MSDYYEIRPEVPGNLGPNTVEDTSVTPPKLHRVEFIFETLPSDDLIEDARCYLISDKFVALFKKHCFSGAELKPCILSTDRTFQTLHPNMEAPRYSWIDITGQAGIHDFGMNSKRILVVSERVLDLLTLDNAGIKLFRNNDRNV
jgi:hypothetical protein